jgi:hypothetical protein
MTIRIDPTHLAEEAYRVGKLGVLDITWINDSGMTKTGQYRIVGFGIDGNENDCLLVAGPYGMSKKNMHRFIIVDSITSIVVSEKQMIDRYGKPITKVQVRGRVTEGGLSEKDLKFLEEIAKGDHSEGRS